jgi:cytochrome subunit of sulfide dehydrogenase
MSWKKVLFGMACFFITQTVIADEKRDVELLASSCASCHGTRGHSVAGTPSLAGLDRLYFMHQMDQFISKTRTSTVMNHHATGYTADEIKLLAEFFSQQKNP